MSDVPSTNNLPIFLQQQMLTACEKNDTRMVDQLILSHPNINVNIRNFEELTPLMMSCRDGYSEITEKLVTASTVDLNCRRSNVLFGDTAAMIAAYYNRPECLKILAKQDRVDWNYQTNKGWTAAICAVISNHVECVRILLTIPHLNWNLRTNENSGDPGRSALTIALENGNKEIINLVLSAKGLTLDIDHLKSKNVFEKAVAALQAFVPEKMDEETL